MNSYYLIGIYLLIIAGIFGIARYFKTFKIDAKPLTQQTLFWLAIVIPIVSFIYFGLFAWWGKTPVFSAHGFERFIKISTLPLGLLSLAIPFTAVINNIHRTVQTNEQIEQTKNKNNLDLLFSHKKSFVEYINSRVLEPFNVSIYMIDYTPENNVQDFEQKFKVTNPYLLYKSVYSINDANLMSTPTPNVSIKYLNEVSSLWSDLSFLIEKISHPNFEENKNSDIVETYKNLESKIFEIIKIIHLSFTSSLNYKNIDVGDSVKIKTSILCNSYLKQLLASLYNFTFDIFIYADNDYMPNKAWIIADYISNPTYTLPLLDNNTRIYNKYNNYIGELI
ncbi:hypothetical protein ACIPUA_22540 [Providencia sp. AGC89]